jgi:hypothetical protein
VSEGISPPSRRTDRAGHWRVGALVAAALLGGTPAVQGETLVFRDTTREAARGKVLFEFDDFLFVATADGWTGFLARAELAHVEDADGVVHESPARGKFAPDLGPAPVAAATGLSGDGWLTREQTDAKPLDRNQVAFLFPRDQVVIEEGALLRVVFLSGADCSLSDFGAVSVDADAGREQLSLAQGLAVVHTAAEMLELTLDGELGATLQPASRLVCERGENETHLVLQSGGGEIVWPAMRLVLQPGLGVGVEGLGAGRWQLSADAVNHAPLEVRSENTSILLAPGETRVVGGDTYPAADVWSLVTAGAEFHVQRAGSEDYQTISPGGRLIVGPGDLVRSGPGEVVFAREDGARFVLEAEALLKLSAAEGLLVLQGTGRIEALSSPVRVGTPGGVAQLRDASLRLERVAVDTLSLEGTPGPQAAIESAVRVTVSGGTPLLRAGPFAAGELSLGSVSLLRSHAGGHVGLDVERGSARVVSSARDLPGVEQRPPLGLDPGFRLHMVAGDRGAISAGARGPVLHLPGGRALECVGAGLDVDVLVAERALRFPRQGSHLRLAENLDMALAQRGGHPQLLFRSGPQVLLTRPVTVEVHNPQLLFEDADGAVTSLELHGALVARLVEGTPQALAVATREEDRLEVARGGAAVLLQDELLRFDVGDGRRLWIEGAAPAVQARYAPRSGPTLHLSMPGTPGLSLLGDRRATVLATDAGEFVVMPEDGGGVGNMGLLDELLVGSDPVQALDRDRLREVADVPALDSPSGP